MIALLTDHRYEAPTDVDWYVGNILEEDRLLADALATRGVETTRVDWARDTDWSAFDAAVFRTTWDYFERLPAFHAFLDRIEPATRCINPVDTVRRNLDKRYLLDLPTVPTVVFERGSQPDLAAFLDGDGVIKPVVSGAAMDTHRVGPGDSALLHQLLQRHDMLLQPFVPDVVERGEVTVVVIDGVATHGVLKVAKAGDFRVQDDHGGTVHPYDPTPAERAFAEQCVAAWRPLPAYARVDIVRHEGQLVVMELELIEPELFLRLHPPAAERLADALVARL